jgi:hypothetical protein
MRAMVEIPGGSTVKPGVSKWELDTPALCVDLDKMEQNIAKMQAALKAVRPAEPATRQDAQVCRHRQVSARHRVDRDLLREAQRGRGDGGGRRRPYPDGDGEPVEEQDRPGNGPEKGASELHPGGRRGAERARSVGEPGMEYNAGSDEFGGIRFTSPPSKEYRIGDVLEVIVPHCDPVVNEYDQIYGIRKDKVEVVWPITARGKSQ